MLGFLLVLTLVFRLFPAWEHVVQGDGEVRLFGVDSYYHLRHVQEVAKSFPVLNRMEDATFYPEVLRSDAIGLFQWSLGGVTRLLGGGDDTARWICAWVGPVQAMMIALLFAWLAAEIWGWRIAVFVSGLLVAFPGPSFERTVFGFCDHHGMEILFNLALVLVWIWASRGEGKWRDVGTWWRPALAGGFVVTGFLFTWIGAPVFITVSLFAVGVSALWMLASGKETRGLLLGTSRVMFVAFFATVVLGFIFPVLRIETSFYGRALLLILVAALACAGAVPVLEKLRGRVPAAVQAISLAILGWGCCLLLLRFVPVLGESLDLVFSHKTTGIREHQPFVWSVIWSNFGPMAFVGVAGTLLAIWRSKTLGTGAFIAIPAAWAILVMWAQTGDYSYNAPAFMVLLTGPFWKEMGAIWERFGGRFSRWQRPLGVALPLAAVVALASTVYPMGRVAGPLRSPEAFRTFVTHSPAWAESLGWLRAVPEAEGGVWCHWPYGNMVTEVSRWPAVQSRYPRGELLAPMFTPGEHVSLALPANGVPFSEAARYVIVDASLASGALTTEIGHMGLGPASIFQAVSIQSPDRGVEVLLRFNQYYTGTLLGRMYTLDGSGLRHFRAVQESTDQSYLRYLLRADQKMGVMSDPAPPEGPELEALREKVRTSALPWDEEGGRAYGALLMPTVKVFEQVAGAQIRYLDEEVVSAKVSLTLVNEASGRSFEYTQEAIPESAGVFLFSLPYSQNPPPHILVRPEGPYRLTVEMKDGRSVVTEIRLSEEAVRDGRVLELKGQGKQ